MIKRVNDFEKTREKELDLIRKKTFESDEYTLEFYLKKSDEFKKEVNEYKNKTLWTFVHLVFFWFCVLSLFVISFPYRVFELIDLIKLFMFNRFDVVLTDIDVLQLILILFILLIILILLIIHYSLF